MISYRKLNKINTNQIIKIVGIILIVSIAYNIDYNKIPRLIEVLENINFIYIISASLFMLIFVIIKGIRWNYINKSLNIVIPLEKIIRICFISNIFAIITPGRIGELIKIKFIYPFNVNKIKLWAGLIGDRIFDLILLLFFGMVSTLIICFM